jgi:hypothetical protein
VVKGYPDWYRRRDIPAGSSLVSAQSVTVTPNTERTLLSVSGKGALTGLVLSTTGWSSTTNVWLKITVDGSTFLLSLPGIAAPVVNSGSSYNSRSTPFVILNIDATNKKAGISLSVPIRFAQSLEVKYRNDGDTANHNIDFILSADLEK